MTLAVVTHTLLVAGLCSLCQVLGQTFSALASKKGRNVSGKMLYVQLPSSVLWLVTIVPSVHQHMPTIHTVVLVRNSVTPLMLTTRVTVTLAYATTHNTHTAPHNKER